MGEEMPKSKSTEQMFRVVRIDRWCAEENREITPFRFLASVGMRRA